MATRSRRSIAIEMLTRPYPLSIRMAVPVVSLMLLVPFYLVIAQLTIGRTLHLPELVWDRMLPVQPAWSVVYASHFFFVLFPVLIMRQEEQIRRTFNAYLMVWMVSYGIFLAYPTIAQRPTVPGEGGFFTWTLRLLYSADPPRNCFPSLHVAHSFVSAFTCYRVHRGVGIACGVWAALIGISTLATKQHYIADVVGGIFLAYVADLVFLRSYVTGEISALDRRGAPILLLSLIGIYGLVVVGFWIFYVTQVR